MRTKAFVTVIATAVLVLGLGVQSAEAHPGKHSHRVCGSARSVIHCDAHVVEAEGTTTPFVTSGPYGLSPAQMKSAYNWPTSLSAGAGKTIAIVGVYDAPTIANDLAVFNSRFGLPACTVASGCLRKVNQTGSTTMPAVNGGWTFETSLDVEWAHAIAPGAAIVLVEATSPTLTNLGAAIDYAKAHAQFVSMSWGTTEYSGETAFDSHFAWSSASFFASSGDSGLPAQYPSASPWVVSVGGTSLHNVGTTSLSETAWSSGGGGCSLYESTTGAQTSFASFPQAGCTKRATPDISADADPNTGAAVYDSTPYQSTSGWFLVGGTSLAAPMMAGRAADRGYIMNARAIYTSALLHWRDVTSGNNGAPCRAGYDLCSGRGSWIGS